MKESKALHLKNVVFRYYEHGKRNILDHVSIDIEEGGITILMGSSGCGKSTMAAVAAGLYPENGGYLESGEIELYGHPVQEMNQQERASYLTMMFQNPDLQFCMDTLRKEMIFCMENLCVDPKEMDDRILATAKLLGTEELLDQKLLTLSGGEKQKAALACLYVMKSRCIVLDEAFANIDAKAARELISLLKLLNAQGKTIIAIDHQLGYWAETADEMIILGEGGQVLQRGITKDNLETYYPLFEQEGIFYPKKRTRRTEKMKHTEAAIVFEGVSIPKSCARKKWGRKEEPEYLLEHGDARFLKGTMTAVIGPSGSGKTTTFLSVLKQHPYAGNLFIGKHNLKKLGKKELFGIMGIVFQNPANQFITQNVEEEVMNSIRIWESGISEEACRTKAEEMLNAYGLKRYYRYSPYMLSQGQQRRLAVLSILAGSQEILLLDEPTYGQDYRSTMAIMEQLKAKVSKEGLTVIFITHDLTLARLWADRVYALEEKKLVEKKPEELEEMWI